MNVALLMGLLILLQGGGGAPLCDTWRCNQWKEYTRQINHITIVEVSGEIVKTYGVDIRNEVKFDEAIINKTEVQKGDGLIEPVCANANEQFETEYEES